MGHPAGFGNRAPMKLAHSLTLQRLCKTSFFSTSARMPDALPTAQAKWVLPPCKNKGDAHSWLDIAGGNNAVLSPALTVSELQKQPTHFAHIFGAGDVLATRRRLLSLSQPDFFSLIE